MGNYITQADLATEITSAKLVELADDDGDSSADSDVVTAAITHAEALFDAAAASAGYSTPISGQPGIVDWICLSLAIFWLYDRPDNVRIPAKVEERHDRAWRLMRQIRRKQTTLPGV